MKLLIILARNSNKLVTRDEIYTHIKGVPYDGFDRSIDTKISHIRRKIGDNGKKPRKIKTICGSGYIFDSESF